VRAADVVGASPENPSRLKVAGGVGVSPGQTVAIPTGGALPDGADAVVRAEQAATVDETTILIFAETAPGENVSLVGDDIKKGETIARRGHRLRPQDLGALAAAGVGEVEVFQPVKVGILSTGGELVALGSVPRAGQVRDVNSHLLAGLVRDSGAEPVRLGICPDEVGALRERLREAVAACAVVVVSGGSSAGNADLTAEAIEGIDVESVMLLPGAADAFGKTAAVALAGRVPVFGLPGHPPGAMEVFRMMVKPVIRYFYTGRMEAFPAQPRRCARWGRNVSSPAGRQGRLRVTLEERGGELWAYPLPAKSGLISLMVRADAVAVIPFGAEGAAQGDEVEVELY
jgi:molybdopterin molybdotransferase